MARLMPAWTSEALMIRSPAQRYDAAECPVEHGRDHVVHRTGQNGKILGARKQIIVNTGGIGRVLHAHDVSVRGQLPDQLGRQNHAAGELRRVVEEARFADGIRYVGKIGREHGLGHLRLEIVGR